MIAAASIATFNNVLLILWGPPFSSELANTKQFPTVMSTSITTESLVVSFKVPINHLSVGVGVLGLMQQFEWSEFALIYTLDDSIRACDYVQLGIQVSELSFRL